MVKRVADAKVKEPQQTETHQRLEDVFILSFK